MTGSGKSYFCNFILQNAQKYEPLTFIFDIGGSFQSLTTIFGGSYLNVGQEARDTSIGDKDQASAIILKSFLNAAETPYAGPSTIQPIVQATLDQGLSPSWDTLTSLLWVMRPMDYFPVKISTWRKLAKEIGHLVESPTRVFQVYSGL
jgi:hypothetical protein